MLNSQLFTTWEIQALDVKNFENDCKAKFWEILAVLTKTRQDKDIWVQYFVKMRNENWKFSQKNEFVRNFLSLW